MKSLGNSLFVIIVFMILGSSCSQTKRLTEGEGVIHRSEKDEYRDCQRGKVGGTEKFGYFRSVRFPA